MAESTKDNFNTDAEVDDISAQSNQTADFSDDDYEQDAEEVFGSSTVIIYHIKDFDGPLDLLCELVKKSKIDFEDFFISDITSQYLKIVAETPKDELDFEYAGEFIAAAAELVRLKSGSLLPPPPSEYDDNYDYVVADDPETERRLFIKKLKEYALLREKSEDLRKLETKNRFYREPVYSDKDYRVALVNFSLPKLVEAFAKVLANAERRGQDVMPKTVLKERFSVSDQIKKLMSVLAVEQKMLFTDLFEYSYDAEDVVTTFLALLELVKYGRLRVSQEENFGEIWIYIVEEMLDKPLNLEGTDDGEY